MEEHPVETTFAAACPIFIITCWCYFSSSDEERELSLLCRKARCVEAAYHYQVSAVFLSVSHLSVLGDPGFREELLEMRNSDSKEGDYLLIHLHQAGNLGTGEKGEG